MIIMLTGSLLIIFYDKVTKTANTSGTCQKDVRDRRGKQRITETDQ